MNLEELEREFQEFEREVASFRGERGWQQVAAKLDRAIATVMERDRSVVADGRNERAVAHRLAIYLQDEFPRWHVDCEFNRQGKNRERKKVAAKRPYLPPSRRGSKYALVDPDVNVHRRGPDGPNLLAIELKVAGSSDLKRDRAKLKAYLTEPHLRYTYAVLVTYYTGANPRFDQPDRIFE
jgi:hypothetical protein